MRGAPGLFHELPLRIKRHVKATRHPSLREEQSLHCDRIPTQSVNSQVVPPSDRSRYRDSQTWRG